MGQGGAVRAKGAAAAAPAAAALAAPRAVLGAMLTRSRRGAIAARAAAPASGAAGSPSGAGGAEAGDAAASARYGLAAKSAGGARAQLTLPTLLTLARVAAVPALLAGAWFCDASAPAAELSSPRARLARSAHAPAPPLRRSALPGGAVGQHRQLRHLPPRRNH
jgi:hypothetical protein